MRVVLTGAAGFIGSHLLDRLLKEDCAVAILMCPDTDPWRIKELLPRAVVLDNEQADVARFEKPLGDFRPDTFIHLAWHGTDSRSYNDPSQCENIKSSLELLRLAHRVGVRHWIGLGSQAEYGNCNHRIDEKTSTHPATVYGTAKLCTCLMAERLCEILDLRFVWLRLFSAYGPKDKSSVMISYLIRSLLRGESPHMTTGDQLWDYLFVADAAEAIYQTAKHDDATGIFNLGSGGVYPIRYIIEQIRNMIAPEAQILFDREHQPDQVMHLEADIGRLQTAIGWAPSTSIEEGLARTVEWYREHADDLEDK